LTPLKICFTTSPDPALYAFVLFSGVTRIDRDGLLTDFCTLGETLGLVVVKGFEDFEDFKAELVDEGFEGDLVDEDFEDFEGVSSGKLVRDLSAETLRDLLNLSSSESSESS
jgi:hypothetical protein